MNSMSRRAVVRGGGAAWLLTAIPGRVFAQNVAPGQAKRAFMTAANEQWKAEHAAALARAREREKKGEFASTLPPIELTPFKDWDFYYCKGRGPSWIPNKGQERYKSVLVPKGFVTDLTSIPQIFWSSGLRPEGAYAYPAIVHDYLYWTQERPRAEADEIFKFSMQDLKVDAKLGNAIYAAVSMFGKSAWEENAQLKKNGERRILREFPPDSPITWAEWKKRPGVFLD